MTGAEDEDPVWQLNLELASIARGVTDPDGLLLVVKARAALGRAAGDKSAQAIAEARWAVGAVRRHAEGR